MDAKNIKWRERYYELENTVEQMITGFKMILDKKTDVAIGAPEISSVHVDTVDKIFRITCCATYCEALEYCFDLIRNGEVVYTTGFIFQNSTEIQILVDRCVITVQPQNGDFVGNEHSNNRATIEVVV